MQREKKEREFYLFSKALSPTLCSVRLFLFLTLGFDFFFFFFCRLCTKFLPWNHFSSFLSSLLLRYFTQLFLFLSFIIFKSIDPHQLLFFDEHFLPFISTIALITLRILLFHESCLERQRDFFSVFNIPF